MYEDAIREFLDKLNERIEEEQEELDHSTGVGRWKARSITEGRLFGLEEARDILDGILKSYNLDVEPPEVWE